MSGSEVDPSVKFRRYSRFGLSWVNDRSEHLPGRRSKPKFSRETSGASTENLEVRESSGQSRPRRLMAGKTVAGFQLRV